MERLFNYFMPENYQLELRVNKETEEVQGHVIILGQTRKTELKSQLIFVMPLSLVTV